MAVQKNLEYYKKLFHKTKVIDETYPVGGSIVWLPYGVRIRENIEKFVCNLLEARNYKKYIFPNLVNFKALEKINKNIKNFERKIFWLNNKRYCLKPTGEPVIYQMFARWIKHESDLPLKVFQIGNLFRPRKGSESLYHGNESNFFTELHCADKNYEACQESFREGVEISKLVLDFLKIPYIMVIRPPWVLPVQRTIQVSAVYLQGQLFSRLFNISFSERDRNRDFTYHTTLGFSERIIYTNLMVYSKNQQLNLLPHVAPYQAAVLCLNYSDSSIQDKVLRYANNINDLLNNLGISSFLDSSEKSLGKKRYKCDSQGIPIKIEIGTKEMKSKSILVKCGELNIQERIRLSQIKKEWFNSIFSKLNIYFEDRRKEILDKEIAEVTRKEDIQKQNSRKTVLKFPLCFTQKCWKKIEESYPGEILGFKRSKDKSRCILCNKDTSYSAFLARRL